MEDFNQKAAIEKAFLVSWETMNATTGWKSAGKTAKLACDAVDKIEWRYINPKTASKPTTGETTMSASPHVGEVGLGLFSGGRGCGNLRKAFRISATLNTNLETVANLLRDVNNVANWNKALQATRIVKRLEPDMVITYQLTAANGNLLSPRDFVFGVKYGMLDNCFVAGGCSLDYPALPEEGDLVRAWNFPGCMVLRPIPGQTEACLFQWLLDCDYGGWVPKPLFEFVVPFSQVMVVESLKAELDRIKKMKIIKAIE